MVRLLLLIGLVFFSLLVRAQDANEEDITVEEMARKRQDPVAGLRSIYLQEVLLPVGDGMASSFSIQPVWPIKLADNLKLITYTIIPIQRVPPLGDAEQSASGLGNILFNGYFSSIKKKGKVSWGIGPAVQIPTRTNAALGSNKVSLGPSALFNHRGDTFSVGFVIENYWSMGGEGANKVNSFNFQYFAYYNLPKGWFLETNTTVVSNWLAEKGEQWLLPAGGGGGKTFQIGQSGLFYCATAQLFYNAVRPAIVGSWEAIAQFQIIF